MQGSNRMNALGSSIFTELVEHKHRMIASGRSIIDLSIGSPNIPPPQHVIDVLCSEVQNKENYMYAIKDTEQLSLSVASWYKSRYGVCLDAETEIVSLLGSQDGLAHIAMTILNEDDVALVPDPCYPIFSTGPRLAGACIVPMSQKHENGYIIDLDAIDRDVAEKAKLMVVSYPNNPTAAVADEKFYKKLVEFAKEFNIVVVHDNAYSDLVFDGKECGSFLAYPGAIEVGIEFNSLSKNFGMAGCRIGFAVGNSDVISKLKCIKSNIDYGMFLPLQKAAVAAITGSYDCVKQTAKAYQERRDVLCESFEGIGWDIDRPPATMFCWARLPKGYNSSRKFTVELMEKTGIIVTPGVAFGLEGEGYVRMALVQDKPAIQEAAKRIEECGMING